MPTPLRQIVWFPPRPPSNRCNCPGAYLISLDVSGGGVSQAANDSAGESARSCGRQRRFLGRADREIAGGERRAEGSDRRSSSQDWRVGAPARPRQQQQQQASVERWAEEASADHELARAVG